MSARPASTAGGMSRTAASVPSGRSLLELPVHAPIAHDAAAGDIAAAAQARAVTIDQHIYVPPSRYRPETFGGRELIAHEQVHVAQQRLGLASGDGAVAAAEAEATRLAPLIARSGWESVRVTQPAARVMRDKIPDEDLSDDREMIRATLEARFPWLAMLSNRREVENEFVERIAYEKAAAATQNKINSLPDPKATYLSDEIEKRQRTRAPFYTKRQHQLEERDKHKAWVSVDPVQLVSKAFLADAAKSKGTAAMLSMLKNYPAWIKLERGGFDTFRYGLSARLDGAWLPLEDDGIHGTSFFKPGLVEPMIYFQQAFYAGSAEDLTEIMQKWVDLDPTIAEQQLDRYVAEQDALAFGSVDRPLTAEEQDVADYTATNKQYAEKIRQKTEKAVAPLILIASFFEIDGPVDLLLAVVPLDKVAGKLFKAGKEAIAARRAAKLEQALIKQFEGHLDAEAKAFLKLAREMSGAEVKALKAINKEVKSPTVIAALMRRSIAESANLGWIAKKLESGHIDGNFVRSFTMAESNPSWKVFEDMVEGRKVAKEARDSLASKIVGVLGERAAQKAVKAKGFAGRELGRADAKITKLMSEVRYGGTKSLDLLGISDKAELIAGEVKNWSTDSWIKSSSTVLDQLDRHNDGLKAITKELGRRAGDVKQKILFVSQEGFSGLSDAMKADLRTKIGNKGWKLQLVADKSIETVGDLIDRVR